jgi:hypothetical protein
MTYLEAWVKQTDGTSKVEHHERNDTEGREAMDRWVFERLLSPRVVEVNVRQVARFASTSGKGTYR